jgi:hypothetical protein
VYYDTTSGVVETSSNNGQAGPTTGVELSFDFASTDSGDGDIEKIWIMPDDGSDTIEQDPADNAILTYTWMTHGVFSAMLGATDSSGNEHSIMVKVKIDMHIVWSESNTGSASMNFDATPDCEDGDPLPDRITIESIVENPGNGFFGGNADVSSSLNEPGGNETASDTGTIGDGQTETWSYTTRAVVAGVWSLNVDSEGDNVNVDNDVTIAYAEGAESATNPRPQ